MKILVAEDEAVIARQYKIALEDRGHEVTLTTNGLECTDVYASTLAQLPSTSEEQLACNPPFDVVVLDYRMPKMDGLEAAKLILDSNKHQRIIFASAYIMATLQESVKYLHAVVELLQKPFELGNMIDLIEDKDSRQELEQTELTTLNSKQDKLPEITHALSVGTEGSKPNMLIIAGLNLARKGRLVDAFECLLEAIRVNPNSAKGWYNIAVCLGLLGNEHHRPLMIYCYDQAIHADPEYFEAWNNKGTIFDQMDKTQNAMECYKRALEINPGHEKARRNLYSLLVRFGNKKEAERYLPRLEK